VWDGSLTIFQQKLDHVQLASADSQQKGRVSRIVPEIGKGTCFQEQPNNLQLPQKHAVMQQPVRVRDFGSGFQQQPNQSRFLLPNGFAQRVVP